jgi:transposase-like protein
MNRYSEGFRNSILKKVLPPEGRPVAQVSREEGISQQTIRNWMSKLKTGTLEGVAGAVPPEQRSLSEKMSLLLESRSLPKEEEGEWLRKNGLHSEHLTLWEQELRTGMAKKEKETQEKQKALKDENRRLKKELDRKEKALAEMAALLTLKKKADAYWGAEEDD